ncbi:MAG: 3-phosphoshikimate 1-carboxyvinyltransferase [Chloroflexi bacterium]|nr:3-phosphoshikimate 1-carboxyvinyltransferase [Chloroflexota bacterium]
MQPTRPIHPIQHPLAARVQVPGSKSITNRALLVAALAEGTTVLKNALFSEDTHHFVNALVRLGFSIQTDSRQAEMSIHGLGGRIPATHADLFIGNAGTAARFLTALLTLGHGEYRLDGVPRMRQRPIADLVEALNQLGAQVTAPAGSPPVRVQATGLPGGHARVRGNISSQFLSALLMTAPYAQQPVSIEVDGPLNSRPYVDLTLGVMADFNIAVSRQGYAHFHIQPGHYQAQPGYQVESDASAASYFFAAPAICGGWVEVAGFNRHTSRQGDLAFVDVLTQMGCRVDETADALRVTAPRQLRGVDVDMRHIPDTAQTLAAIAPFAETPTTIRGIASARLKESDRVSAMCAELTRLGVQVVEHPDGLMIHPAKNIQPATIRTYNDHRMAMAFALIGLRVPGIHIENPACTAKTFPNYFDVLETLAHRTPS